MSDEAVQTFASVWDALTDTPEQAANMRLRAELALAIQRAVEGWGGNHAGAAERLRVTQPRLAELLEGRLDLFSVDELATLAERVGLAVEMRIAHAAA
ncbi:MAG TPA: XRE family transcriptional regulator [Acetobacteraceae bacterium]|jgi:predicted XRE-type DNA-binding protein